LWPAYIGRMCGLPDAVICRVGQRSVTTTYLSAATEEVGYAFG
jgi:hypothetical protein